MQRLNCPEALFVNLGCFKCILDTNLPSTKQTLI